MNLLDGHLDKRWAGAAIPADHWHFHRRLFERYGAVLQPREFSKMMRRFRKGTAPLIQRDGQGREIRLAHFAQARAVPVVVNGPHVLTALPQSAVRRRRLPHPPT